MALHSLLSKEYEVLSADDTVSKAISVFSNGAKAILIQDGGNAVVTHKALLRSQTPADKVKLRSLFSRMPILDIEASFEDAVKTLLVNGIDAAPVESKGKIAGIVTESSLLRNLGKDYESSIVKDVMTPAPICVNETDEIAKAKNLMIENNISRLPVLGKNGKISGIVEDIDLLKVFIPNGERLGRGVGPGKTKPKDHAPVRDVMRDQVYTAWAQESVLKVAQKLNEHRTCVIVEDGKPIGIVTPKDILETVPVPEEGIYAQITGLHEEDEFTTNEVHREINSVVKKLSAIVNIQFVWIHVKHTHDAGGKIKYSIRSRASTDWGLFVSKYWGYDLIDATSQAMKEVEREVMKHKEKLITKKKGRGPAAHSRKD